MQKKLLNYFDYLSDWLKFQVKKANMNGVVFGLSGGIDSALMSILAKKTFPNDYLALIMHINNTELDHKATDIIVKEHKLNSINLDFTSSFNYIVKTLDLTNIKDDNKKKLIMGNLKSRLRTNILYVYAQLHNYLVLGTSNYDEWMLGYFTKYGDSACDLMPFKWLIKKEIRELSKYYKVPEIIINRPPTAGLYLNQTDESELKISYDKIDDILLMNNIPTERFVHLHKSSSHKRKLPLAPKKFHNLLQKVK